MSLQSLRNLGKGGAGFDSALPKAIAELQGLTISGPLNGASSGTAIAVTGIEAEDTVLKCLMLDGTSALPTDETSNTTIVDRRASGTLTLSGIVAGDVVSVNDKTYTFVAARNNSQNLAPGTVEVGTTDTLSAANLAKQIMSYDSTLIASSSGAVVTITYRTAGTGGNAVTLAVTASNSHATRSGANLAGGTATNAIKIAADTSGNKILLFWYNKQ